jgi:hypothetical protein
MKSMAEYGCGARDATAAACPIMSTGGIATQSTVI